MKEKVPLSYRANLDHLQVSHRFAVQNLTLPPSMPVAKVTEYVYCERQCREQTEMKPEIFSQCEWNSAHNV